MAAAIPDKGGTQAPLNFEPKQAPKEALKKLKDNAAATQSPSETKTAVGSYFGKVPHKWPARWPGGGHHHPHHHAHKEDEEDPPSYLGKDVHAMEGKPAFAAPKGPPPFIRIPFGMLKFPTAWPGRPDAKSDVGAKVPTAMPMPKDAAKAVETVAGDFPAPPVNPPGNAIREQRRDNAPVPKSAHGEPVMYPQDERHPTEMAGESGDNAAYVNEDCRPMAPRQPEKDSTPRRHTHTSGAKETGGTRSGSAPAGVTVMPREKVADKTGHVRAAPGTTISPVGRGASEHPSRIEFDGRPTVTDDNDLPSESCSAPPPDGDKHANTDTTVKRPFAGKETPRQPTRDRNPAPVARGRAPDAESARESAHEPAGHAHSAIGRSMPGKTGGAWKWNMVTAPAMGNMPELGTAMPSRGARAIQDNIAHSPVISGEKFEPPVAVYENGTSRRPKPKGKARTKASDDQDGEIARLGIPYAIFEPKVLPVVPLARHMHEPEHLLDIKSGELEGFGNDGNGWYHAAPASVGIGEESDLPSAYVPNGG